MSNYNSNYFNLPLDTLTNIAFFNPSSIDGCNIIVIKADTIRKSTYLCDKCGSIHSHTIKEYKPVLNKYLVFNNNLVILNVNKKRFICYDCNSTFTETIPSINKCARISNNLKKLIADDFIISNTSKAIAIKHFVSQSTVSRLAILPSRKSFDLERYFQKFSQKALDNVKVVGYG